MIHYSKLSVIKKFTQSPYFNYVTNISKTCFFVAIAKLILINCFFFLKCNLSGEMKPVGKKLNQESFVNNIHITKCLCSASDEIATK